MIRDFLECRELMNLAAFAVGLWVHVGPCLRHSVYNSALTFTSYIHRALKSTRGDSLGPWACTQPYICTWSSRFSGICWGISMQLRMLWMLRASLFPFKLLFIVCPNCYPSSHGSCEIAVINLQMLSTKDPGERFLALGEDLKSGQIKEVIWLGCPRAPSDRSKSGSSLRMRLWKSSGFILFYLALGMQAVILPAATELGEQGVRIGYVKNATNLSFLIELWSFFLLSKSCLYLSTR